MMMNRYSIGVLIAALALAALSALPARAATSGDVPVNITVTRRMYLKFTGHDIFQADISDGDARKGGKIFNDQGELQWKATDPFKITAHRYGWTRKEGNAPGWTNGQSDILFGVRKKRPKDNDLAPLDPDGFAFVPNDGNGTDWFWQPAGNNHSDQIDYKLNWSALPNFPKGHYNVTVEFTISTFQGP